VSDLPSEIVMTADDLVDAALAGLDQRELVTIPALADKGEWDGYQATRRGISTHLSRAAPAARYGIKH
jgi:short-subunit dehydrogenase